MRRLAQMRAAFQKFHASAVQFLSAIDDDPANLNRAYAQSVKAEGYIAEAASQKDFDDLVTKMAEVAGHRRDHAEALLREQRFDDAIEVLESLALLRKLDVGPFATAALRNLGRNPDVRAAMLEDDAEFEMRQIDALLDSVGEPHFLLEYAEHSMEEWAEIAAHDAGRAERLSVEEQMRIVSLLQRMISRFEETCCGERAAALLHELSNDEELMATVRRAELEEQFRRDFNMARNYAMNGIDDQARVLYEGILAEDPGDEWRIRVETELSRLR